MEKTRDNTQPGKDWKFDANVTKAFDDMLSRSIPQYQVMREACHELARRFVSPGAVVVDIGCSRGESMASLVNAFPDARFIGLEVSEPMAKAAQDRFKDNPDVTILRHDLRKGVFVGDASLILSVLTLQFIPINYRQMVIEHCYRALRPGGALILVEKVLGATARIDSSMVDIYHGLKQRNGYSRDDIDRKRLALEGVLVPVTSRWNEDLLRSAGFTSVDVFWRWMNFAGWVAVR